MEVSRIRALRGPNLWSRRTVLETIISCTEPERAIAGIPHFETRLRARFPAIGLLQPAGQEYPVSMARALGLATLGLQSQAGCPVTFIRTVRTVEAGIYQVVVEYTEEEVGRLALKFALELCEAARHDTPFDLESALAQLRDLDEDIRIGPSTGSIVQAAVQRGIPYRRLTRGSLIQFGWGKRQRRIQAAEMDRSSAIAESIAQDKELTKALLHAAGVPVPQGRPVSGPEDAWAAAQEIGAPVVVKPRDGNQGKGVAVNVSTREQVLAAYAAAEKYGSAVLVERYIPGHDFRLLVVGNTLAAASRRDPPQVFGDAVHTIRELIEEVNKDPRRGEGHATSLTKIRLDDIAVATLAKSGYTPDSIPLKGALVILRNNANLSTGGTATDVTDDVHPEFAAHAIAAARTVGLDICGVDVVADTVIRPLEAQGGAIVEVNAAPGLRMHLAPSYGNPRAVGDTVIAEMFAAEDDGRIPVVAVAGTNGKTTTVRLIAHLLGVRGHLVGMTNSDGVYIGQQRIDVGDCSGPRSARNVLLHPDVDAAVFETARGGILREGLGFDRCDVAVVTNIGMGDHLGLNFISTVEDLAVVKRVIVENVAPTGTAVLNATDPNVANMAGSCPGSVIFFSNDRQHTLITTQRAKNQRVVYCDGEAIVAARNAEEQRIALNDIPLTYSGAIDFQIENAMAAIAAAWALGLDWQVIRRGLASFVNDAQTAPGRFNRFEFRGATIFADYGHNPDAIQALVRAIERMPAKRRSVVISGAGDRRDVDIRRQTEILGTAFDQAVLYEDQCQRGRQDGEVLALLREGLAGATRTYDVREIRGEFLAIDTAMDALGPGDLCLILVDQVEEALAHIERRIAADCAISASLRPTAGRSAAH